MGKEIRDKVKHYIFEKNELESTYPTDCPIGSDMEIKDDTIHEVIAYKEFDGMHWNNV